MLELAVKRADQGRVDRCALELAHHSAKDLLGLIGDILDIVRIESGHLSLAPEAVEHLLAAIRALATGYDIVLLDLGSGLDHAVRRLTAAADSLVVVATEEPTSLTDAYAVLKLHARDRTPPCTARIVINQAASLSAGRRVFLTLSQACTRYLGTAPTLLGIIRRDDKVLGNPRAVLRG